MEATRHPSREDGLHTKLIHLHLAIVTHRPSRELPRPRKRSLAFADDAERRSFLCLCSCQSCMGARQQNWSLCVKYFTSYLGPLQTVITD
jgi:hypothetical protein